MSLNRGGKKPEVPEVTFVTPTLTFVDIDDTLTKRRSPIDATPVYNEEFIKALKDSGVTQIYLFSSMSMKEVLPTSAEQKEFGGISRLELIRHLEAPPNSIKVLGLISNFDLAHPGMDEKPLGHYYREVIRPFEEKLEAASLQQGSEGPLYDLRSDPEYLAALKRETTQAYVMPAHGIKEKLADKFFPMLQEQYAREGRVMPPCQFFDDRQENLDQAARAAQKAGVSLKTFEVTTEAIKEKVDPRTGEIKTKARPETTYKDYMDFLATPLEAGYRTTLMDSYKSTLDLKTRIETEGVSSKYKNSFLEPINRILTSFVHIHAEMQKDKWNPSRDNIEACDGLIKMMNKLKEKYQEIPLGLLDFKEKNIRDAALREMDRCIGKLNNMKKELGKHYSDTKDLSANSAADNKREGAERPHR